MKDLHFARQEQIRDETMASRTRERSRHGLARHLFPAPFSTSHGQRPLYFTQGASRATPSSNLSPPRRPQHKENTRRSVVIRTHCLPSVCADGRREGLAAPALFCLPVDKTDDERSPRASAASLLTTEQLMGFTIPIWTQSAL